ncbi:uncharacterized protein LOC119835665 [Zerene cesonia]|uniref:uncharacterized protein LOC119835665 n=1 Tax=Zerene cesonia TaxID=33412 RepID=UPI0018E54E1B|nr:uncharacterized protein LOC119835665 [Zerene cesonia]
MDLYAHFEANDFLDYLIPPVKKNSNVDRDPLLLFERYSYRKYPGFPIRKPTFRNIHNTKAVSSVSHTSLFLKKPTKRFLQEQCSILDVIPLTFLKNNKSVNTTQSKICNRHKSKEEKPVIKITVIQKPIKTQTANVFNKRIFKKEIIKTVSNQDNSIKNKNVYLVVSGRKREKIYEIKTSESENLSNRWSHPLKRKFPVKQSSKQVLDSMDMDRRYLRGKKKKDGKLFGNQDDLKPKSSGHNNMHKECKSSKLNIASPKSRVTIFGRLGLTDNDQYVLNCAATVNNKPSKYSSSVFHYPYINDANGNDQTDEYQSTNLEKYRSPRMESQGIQVNLCASKSKTKSKYMKDQYIQCMCQNADINKSVDENENILTQSQNPIVVISVYPKFEKGDTNLSHTVKVEQQHAPSPKHALYKETQVGTSKKSDERNFISREGYRSKSPTSFLQGKSDFYTKNDRNRLRSPNRAPNYSPNVTRKFNNDVNQKIYSKQDVGYAKSNFKNENGSRPTRKPFSNETRSETETLNASRNLAKKALVDSYMNKLHSEEVVKTITRKNFLVPKDDASKVTINIDGETEQYDLIFEQNNQNTNLSVKKTMKESSNKRKTDMRDTASLENLLDFSQELLPTENSVSKRGSLSSGGNNSKPAPSANTKQPSNSTQFSSSKAHAKHYRGDNCFIPDPTERDKEIRELLGILTGKKCQAETNSKQRIQKFFKKIKNVKVDKPIDGDNKKPTCKSSLPHLDDNRQNVRPPTKTEEQQDDRFKSLNNAHVDCKCFHNPAQRNQNEMQKEDYGDHNKFPNNNQYNIPIEPKKPLMCPHCKEPRNPKILNKTPNDEKTNDASLILNRNIQIFLEVEQFKKQRPIVLTRKQYDKVKKAIQSTISKKTSNEKRRSAYYNNYSIVSIGDVKIRSKCQQPICTNKEVQTESFGNNRICSELLSSLESFERHEASLLSHSMLSFDKNQEIGCRPDIGEDPNNLKIVNQHALTRNAMSSLEVRYASVAFKKHVTYSSPLCNKGLESSLFSSSAQNRSDSLHTIFKGYKKSATPNLGTSAFSLCSDTYSRLSDKSKGSQQTKDPKYKKPLLQRLVSCLIMRSARVSEVKVRNTPDKKEPTLNSSIDSYHFSSSLAGFEMPSSMYDTSISFYSNHTIMPVNRIKRGFFSSMRGFLTNRRN